MLQLLKKINRKYQIKIKAENFISKTFCIVFGLLKPNMFSVLIADRVSQMFYKINDKYDYLFLATNPLLYWRGKTLLTKEVETIEWLDSLKQDDVLYDIGANIGVYSIYAGKNGHQVFAFEPGASNYSILNTNIHANDISSNVKSFCLAISDSSLFSTISLSSLVPGSAHNCFADNKNYADEEFVPKFEQGCFSMTLDEVIYTQKLPVPTYLKVDVDGLESKIIAGAKSLLQDPILKSVLIELNENLDRDIQIIASLKENGFSVFKKGPTEGGQGTLGVRNFIFKRE
jgi:FkbM family methyltransferase